MLGGDDGGRNSRPPSAHHPSVTHVAGDPSVTCLAAVQDTLRWGAIQIPDLGDGRRRSRGTSSAVAHHRDGNQLPANDDSGDPARVVDVHHRIRVQQHQVGHLPAFHCAHIGEPEKPRGVSGRTLKGFHWRHACFDEESQFAVKVHTGTNARTGVGEVRAGQDGDPCTVHRPDKLHELVVESAATGPGLLCFRRQHDCPMVRNESWNKPRSVPAEKREQLLTPLAPDLIEGLRDRLRDRVRSVECTFE